MNNNLMNGESENGSLEPMYMENWDKALGLMQKAFTSVVFDTWIRPLKPIRVKDGLLFLKTEENFFKPTIEERYLNTITDCLKEAAGYQIPIKLVSPEDFETVKKSGGKRNDANIKNSNLKPKYVFENFVRGKSNEFAYAAALAVAEAPGKTTYNPLFLYGGVGLGKTHLMHSIGNYILSQNSESKVLYISTETFMNELINSIRERKNQEFRNKYRDIDVLLVDDIQFLSEKEGTQEEFFHTFNTLYDANKQIVISSDQPPKEIKTLEERLRSRFGCGLIVDITLPDFETRTAILDKKAELENLSVPKDVIHFIAKNIVSNIRDLEGALNKVTYSAKIKKEQLTVAFAEKEIKDLINNNIIKEITLDHIAEIITDYYKISVADMCGKKRTQNLTYPRQIFMYMSRKLLDISLLKLGEYLGGRDHSTIMHGCEKISQDIESDQNLKVEIRELEKRIKGE